jgi:3-methyladenine DNA glycosylase AlkD
LRCEEVIAELKKQANPASVAGMASFGINPENTLGVAIPFLRAFARKIKKDHALAIQLWETGIHEARILATMVADAGEVAEELMERWAQDFDSWDVCDQCCSNLFRHTAYAYLRQQPGASALKNLSNALPSPSRHHLPSVIKMRRIAALKPSCR